MEKAAPLYEIVMGNLVIPITFSMVIQWCVMLFLTIAAIYMSSNLKSVPKGKQIFSELIVENLYKMVDENMGKGYENFKPFIGSVFIFVLTLNLTGLVGIKPQTSSYSTALGLALITFTVIQATAIKKNGILHYFTAFAKPLGALLPINIMERITVPVSLSLRMFGNIMAASIIVELAYKGLAAVSELLLHTHIPILATFIAIPLHLYFDIFDGTIQTLIFTMLTMIFIKTTSEH